MDQVYEPGAFSAGIRQKTGARKEAKNATGAGFIV
jgi:hypothetical protein